MEKIHSIVIHCAATRNGVSLARKGISAAQRIDDMHAQRGFKRGEMSKAKFNSHLKAIGYHFVIDVDGKVETGRALCEQGAHVKGHNKDSIGICLVGGVTIDGKNFGRYTKSQWASLTELISRLKRKFPRAHILGHRDFIGVNKDCPCFDVGEWLIEPDAVESVHLFKN